MKKIIAARIEQIIEFDGKAEYTAYMEGLKRKKQQFQEISFEQLESGAVRARVRKQYGSSKFPDE